MRTNWRDFGIGMASGIAFCFVLYFGWGLIHPHRPEAINNVAASNASVGMDENALIAANAERPNTGNNMTPPPQLRPEPQRNEAEPRVLLEPEPRPEPPVTRPRPRPDPDDEPPPEDLGPDDDDGGKPDN